MLLIVTEIPKGPSIIRDLDHGNKIWIAEMRLPVRREYQTSTPRTGQFLLLSSSFNTTPENRLTVRRVPCVHMMPTSLEWPLWSFEMPTSLEWPLWSFEMPTSLEWPLLNDTWNSLNRQSIFRCCNWLTVSVNFQMLYWRCLEGAEEILNNWKANWWTPAILYLFTKKKNNCLCSEFDILYMQYREPIWSGGRHDCFYNWFYV